jgi:hypothetical protein
MGAFFQSGGSPARKASAATRPDSLINAVGRVLNGLDARCTVAQLTAAKRGPAMLRLAVSRLVGAAAAPQVPMWEVGRIGTVKRPRVQDPFGDGRDCRSHTMV